LRPFFINYDPLHTFHYDITVERGAPPTLHEVRSLAERLYRAQGVDTRILLGHRRQQMTDRYNDDRGLSRKQWQYLPLPEGV
jgi:phage integrase